MLLFTAIERFVSQWISLNSKKSIMSKLNTFSATPEFAEAFEGKVNEERIVRDRSRNNVRLDPASPKTAMKYYYQVRSTSAHTGKVGYRDYSILRVSTMELLKIFTQVRDMVFLESEELG